MSLLWPLALVGLAALGLPLWLHRHRQTETRRRDFAALRHVGMVAVPRSRPRWREIRLLALRLALLAVAVIWLATPLLPETELVQTRLDGTRRVLVHPALPSSRLAALRREAEAGQGWSWLAPGFPDFAEPAPERMVEEGMVEGAVGVFSLLREQDASLAPGIGLRLELPARLDGLDAALPDLSRDVDWRVAEDSRPPPMPRVHVQRSAAPGEPALLAALRALNETPPGQYRLSLGSAGEPLSVGGDWLIRLGTPPEEDETCVYSRRRLSDAWPDGAASWPVLAGSGGRLRGRQRGCAYELALIKPLTEQDFPELGDTRFPALLQTWLAEGGPWSAPAVLARPEPGGAALPRLPGRWFESWLAALLVLLLAGERFLATRATRRLEAA